MARFNSLWTIFIALLSFSIPTFAEFWSCDFSDGMCGLIDYALPNKSWILTNSSQIDPGHDNTCTNLFEPVHGRLIEEPGHVGEVEDVDPSFELSSNCYWLTTLPVDKFRGTQDFILFSPKLQAMQSDGCIRFYYHFFGLSKASFQLQINSEQSIFGVTNLWAKFVPQGNRWAHAQVHVPKQTTGFYFIFKAHLDSKYHDIVGIDDVSYVSYPCPLTGDTDFEAGNQAWVSDGVDIVTGGEPTTDHTTNTDSGHFALSTTKQPSTLTATVKNLTQTFMYSSEYYNCLKFYYQFISDKHQNDVDSYLSINVSGYSYVDRTIRIESIFAEGLENSWQLMAFNIPSFKKSSLKNYSVTLSMYTSKDSRIAIDDIMVLDRSCQSVGDCDFESDFCGWTQSRDAKGIWLRSDGANAGGLKESPKIDHTTFTEKGWFAMIPNEYMSGQVNAALRSPPLSDSARGKPCFQFSYFAHTEPPNAFVLLVSLIDLSKGLWYSPIIEQKVYGTKSAVWSNFTLMFPKKMPRRYGIEILAAYSPRGLKSDIAIDDLKFPYSCGRDDQPTTTPTPIPYSERKWDCTFDFLCSGWKFDSNWVRTSFSKLGSLQNNVNPPRVDHTYHTHTGGYLLYVPKYDGASDATTQIISTVNSTQIKGAHCFMFYYYDASEVLIRLDINLVEPDYLITKKSVRPNAASRTWARVRVDFQRYTTQPFNISLVLHAGKGANTSFAIDDIKLIPGECTHMEDYTYTFDRLDKMDVNYLTPIKGIGRLVNSDALSLYPYAPKHDHTTGSGGYFLFMNQRDDYNTTYESELVINNLEKMPIGMAITGRCIKFAYQAVGNVVLKIFIDNVDSNYHGHMIFETAANHSEWTMVQETFSAYYDHKISFIMRKKFDEKSYIAIDDVSFSDNCPRTVQCDFDNDLCSYTSDNNDYNYTADYEFARFVGPALTQQWPGPSYDHTKQGYGGGYLYLTGFPSNVDFTRSARLQTPINVIGYDKSTNACISLFTSISAPDAEVKVGVRFFSSNGRTSSTNLITLSGITETEWTRHFVDIDGHLFKNNVEFIFTIEGTTKKSNTLIAIDDVSYSVSGCEFRHKFTCADSKTIVTLDQVCNFHDDCGDNSDEKGCGTCDFEKDHCLWMNGSDYKSALGGVWVTTQARSSSDPRLPNVDADGKKDGHFLMVKKSPYSNQNYQFIGRSTLTRFYYSYRFQFKHAYLNCSVSFYSYIHSENLYQPPSVQVWVGSDVDSAVIKLDVPFDSNMTGKWNRNTAYIGSFPYSFVVQFHASGLYENETVAIDNVKFEGCAFPSPVKSESDCPDERAIMCNTTRVCISAVDLCDFENDCGDNWDENYALCTPFNTPDVPVSCAFERSIDTCGMTIGTEQSKIFWSITRGSEWAYIAHRSPSADHTTKDKSGQYLGLNVRNSQHLGKTVLAYSPMMHSDSDPCIVRFFYYNNGRYNATKNVFSVYVQYADGSEGVTGSLFKSNSYLDTWIKASAKIKSKQPFRFVFAGIIYDDKGSIALDDISYTDNCYNSDAVYKPGSPRATSAFVVILLIVLSLVLVGGAFFAFRKYQAGELSLDSVQTRVRSFIPGSNRNPTAFDNPHFNQ